MIELPIWYGIFLLLGVKTSFPLWKQTLHLLNIYWNKKRNAYSSYPVTFNMHKMIGKWKESMF